MKTKTQTVARVVRWLVLAASTIFFLCSARIISEHAVCPIGGFELFFNGVFATGFTVAGLFSGMVLTFLAMSIFSIIFRRAYCGYICPIGALQELFERVGKLALPKKLRSLRVPPKVDRVLRWGKYLVLALFLVGAYLWNGHWMIPGDIFMVFMSLSRGDIGSLVARLPYAFAFFVAVLLFAFFFGRGFCKYFCPAGAWYALLSKISPNKIVRDDEKCVGCGLCSKACPMNIDVANLKKVDSAECIGCRECVNACPRQGALSAPIGKFDIPAVAVPVAAAAVFAGTVYYAASHMPVRGGKPGGGRPAGQGPQGGQFRGGNSDNQKVDGKVGYGGCPGCVGCGLCETPAKV